MRKRIYWLLPDHASARQTMNDLLLARIDKGHIHFAASENAETEGLHMASILQTSDLVVAAQNGALIGAGLGAAPVRWPPSRSSARGPCRPGWWC